MPDRLIRTTDGVLGGLLVIVGLIYIVIGWSWMIYPTPARIEGLDWLPVEVDTHQVGWWWAIGGAITVVCAAFSTFRWVETVAVLAGMGTSAGVATIFLAVWVGTSSPGALITAVTYGGWAAIVAWVSARTALNALKPIRVRRPRPGGARD